MLALAVTVDLGGVIVAALAAVAFLAAVALLWRRTGKVETRLGSIEVGVGEVSRQVNHVQDPEREPTIRQMVSAMHGQVTTIRIEQAATNRHLAETRRLVEQHLAAHRAEDESKSAGRGSESPPPNASGGSS